MQRVFHRGNDIRTPLDLVKATDLVAEASNEDEVDRSKDDDGDLADTLTKSPRETRDAPRKDMFGGGEAAGADFLRLGADGGAGVAGQIAIAFDEFRLEGKEQSQHVVDHKDLPVTAR